MVLINWYAFADSVKRSDVFHQKSDKDIFQAIGEYLASGRGPEQYTKAQKRRADDTQITLPSTAASISESSVQLEMSVEGIPTVVENDDASNERSITAKFKIEKENHYFII